MPLTTPLEQVIAGDLRHEADFQSATKVVDALGGRSETWSTFASRVPAGMKDVPLVKSEDDATVVRLVTIRYRDDVRVEQRVIIDGLTLKILAIEQPGGRRKRKLILHCAEVTT